ncbi:MAG: hypothetical protein L0213_07295 [Candidatus Dadabacteria bacterium]|nr:hypothetical protein [Candidatus Dadabacteria bacterium]
MANILVYQTGHEIQPQPSGVDVAFNIRAWGKTSTGGIVSAANNYMVSEKSLPDVTPSQFNNGILDHAQAVLVDAGAEAPGLFERRMLIGSCQTIVL